MVTRPAEGIAAAPTAAAIAVNLKKETRVIKISIRTPYETCKKHFSIAENSREFSHSDIRAHLVNYEVRVIRLM